MGDLDFAHGIPPERFRCKRPKNVDRFDRICAKRCARTPGERSEDRPNKVIHWSLDEGRWIFHEVQEVRRPADTNAQRECNTFIRFKNLVDNGVGALNLAKKQRELNQLRQKEEDAAWQRWTGLPPWPEYRTPIVPRSYAVKAARYLLEIADRAVHFEEPSMSTTFNELFKDDQGPSEPPPNPMLGLGAWYMCPEVADSLPSTAGLFRPPPPATPRWLTIDWFKRSPYSPIQIEAIEGMAGQLDWRDAFEDLMFDSTERSLRRRSVLNQKGKSLDPSQPAGIDWVLSLQTRGILPPILPSLHRGSTSEWIRTNYSINSDVLDYKEFSNLVDEIWLTNRAYKYQILYERLLYSHRNVPRHTSVSDGHFEVNDNEGIA